MSKRVPLTQGKFAIIDNEDFERVSKFKWHYRKKRPNTKTGYAARGVRKLGTKSGFTTQAMHTFILGLNPFSIVDHINHDGLDNRKINIRKVDHFGNTQNALKRIDNKSGFKGVCIHKASGKFCAQIMGNKDRIWLGLFNTALEAAKAYNKAAKKYYGEYACLNKL